MNATMKPYRAVPTYMGPDWSLHMSHPNHPEIFKTIQRDFTSRESAEEFARTYAAEQRAAVRFFSSIPEANESATD